MTPEGAVRRPSTSRERIRAGLAGGAIAGVLDILAAFAVYAARGVRPVTILQSIASGLLGASAFQGGAGTAALGLALHFLIATTAACVYVLASLKLPALVRSPWTFGPLYGIAVYAFMAFVVVPLSAVAKRPFSPGLAAVILLVHVACVGLPIALTARRFVGSDRT
jgi:hypothetical protein